MALTTRGEQLRKVQDEGLTLFEKKNKDYGDAFATYGTVGVLVRIGDKIMRQQNITNKGVTLVDDEQLRDTLIDLHNYAGMAVMLMDSEFKEEPILENNGEKVISWGIYGTNGDVYTRTQTRVCTTIIKEECTCNAFKYSRNNTCKHILNSDNFNTIN